MKRVSVVGSAGSGKSTVAAALAPVLGVPHVELDALYHQADWQPKSREELRAEIREIIKQPGWVVDGNYGSKVRDLVWEAADTVVWLDPTKTRVMTAVFGRTLGRVLGRKVLWNGNRERLRDMFSRDPLENLLAWTWKQFDHYRDTYTAASVDPAYSPLEFIHLRSRREVREWLKGVGASTG